MPITVDYGPSLAGLAAILGKTQPHVPIPAGGSIPRGGRGGRKGATNSEKWDQRMRERRAARQEKLRDRQQTSAAPTAQSRAAIATQAKNAEAERREGRIAHSNQTKLENDNAQRQDLLSKYAGPHAAAAIKELEAGAAKLETKDYLNSAAAKAGLKNVLSGEDYKWLGARANEIKRFEAMDDLDQSIKDQRISELHLMMAERLAEGTGWEPEPPPPDSGNEIASDGTPMSKNVKSGEWERDVPAMKAESAERQMEQQARSDLREIMEKFEGTARTQLTAKSQAYGEVEDPSEEAIDNLVASRLYKQGYNPELRKLLGK